MSKYAVICLDSQEIVGYLQAVNPGLAQQAAVALFPDSKVTVVYCEEF